MNIIERLDEIMYSKNITRAKLAREIGIAPSTLQSWMTRGSDFPSQYVMPICQVIGVTPYMLLTGEEAAPAIPEGAMIVSEYERFFVETLRKLDREAMVVVMAAAVSEARRLNAEIEPVEPIDE